MKFGRVTLAVVSVTHDFIRNFVREISKPQISRVVAIRKEVSIGLWLCKNRGRAYRLLFNLQRTANNVLALLFNQ